jgi:hypothetical protein
MVFPAFQQAQAGGRPDARPTKDADALCDVRFRRLVGTEAWQALPALVRARFAKRLQSTQAALYEGRVVETRMSRCGWLLAQACRLFGAPLPLHRDGDVPALVCVTEEEASGGQCWTRIYGCHSGFPQVIRSAKMFTGPTGLEEHLGRGIGMALQVVPEEHGLLFVSDHYFVRWAGVRLRLPHWLGPGRTEVRHRDRGEGAFDFDLTLTHPLLGELLHQHAEFRDVR